MYFRQTCLEYLDSLENETRLNERGLRLRSWLRQRYNVTTVIDFDKVKVVKVRS